LPGLFIDVRVSPEASADARLAERLAEVCPVDIFRAARGRIDIVEANLDECVLCDLCLSEAPRGAVQIVKLYED
jgi:NAD-dependent dihydropyrimidine dehydrogenase PreA subunit